MKTLIDVERSWATLLRESGYKQFVHGVGVWKNPDDLDRYRAVIQADAPEVIVETGTRWGGSALWFADRVPHVITVDIHSAPSTDARLVGPRELLDRISWVTGDSAAPDVVEQVTALVAGRRCMVSLDSEHAAPHVAAEIDAYGPLVTSGCHLVVEDGLADLVTSRRAARLGRRIPAEGGPLVAVRRQLEGHPGWERDEQVEAMSPISHHPAGWWRRVDNG